MAAIRSIISGILKLFKEPTKLVILGLDNAGKTTMLNYLLRGEPGSTIPTVGVNFEKFTIRGVEFNVWDLGGQRALRRIWEDYAENADAVIFVVDSADRSRFKEAKEELWRIISVMKRNKPLLIVANKADLDNAATVMEIIDALDLRKLEDRTWQIVWASALTGFGLFEAFAWIYEKLTGKEVSHPLRIEELVVLDERGNPLISTTSTTSLTLSAFVSLMRNYTTESLRDIPQTIEMRDKKLIIAIRGGLIGAALIPRYSSESKVKALLVDVLNNIAEVRDREKAREVLIKVVERYVESEGS
ncbi:MAG: Arf family protein [Candidatus Korarchaeum sp.]